MSFCDGEAVSCLSGRQKPYAEVEEAAQRDFSLKPRGASDTIIASAICCRDSFRGRAVDAKTLRTWRTSREIKKRMIRGDGSEKGEACGAKHRGE